MPRAWGAPSYALAGPDPWSPAAPPSAGKPLPMGEGTALVALLEVRRPLAPKSRCERSGGLDPKQGANGLSLPRGEGRGEGSVHPFGSQGIRAKLPTLHDSDTPPLQSCRFMGSCHPRLRARFAPMNVAADVSPWRAPRRASTDLRRRLRRPRFMGSFTSAADPFAFFAFFRG